MSIKKTKLLVAELRVIADSVISEYCRSILDEAADRLEDTDKIAQFYHSENERLQAELDKRPPRLIITKKKG